MYIHRLSETTTLESKYGAYIGERSNYLPTGSSAIYIGRVGVGGLQDCDTGLD